jgi:hypothetical protein
MKRIIWLSLLLLVFVGRTLAQADCPTIVETALQLADDACAELGRNEACYGNVRLEAEAQPTAQTFTFEQTGDIVNLNDVFRLHLSPMDADSESWGVALLQTQANLPDTLPGQNVTMVLFGQVDITDAAPAESEATPEATEDEFIAFPYAPMQAFYFTSGIGDAPCAEAPDSGILIQTPQGVGSINLLVNGVELSLGSTAYLTACPCGDFVVNVIEGHGVVSALGTTIIVPAGTSAHIPLDENSVPLGPPVGPEPYDDTKMAVLPIILLPQTITPAASLTEEEIAAFSSDPIEGEWTLNYTITGAFPANDFLVGLSYSYVVEFEDGEFHSDYVDEQLNAMSGGDTSLSWEERAGITYAYSIMEGVSEKVSNVENEFSEIESIAITSDFISGTYLDNGPVSASFTLSLNE